MSEYRFEDVLDLEKLPYFKLAKDGRNLIYTGDGKDFIDFHTHVGGSYLFGKPINWFAKSQAKTFFPKSKYPVNLKQYSAFDFPVNLIRECRKETMKPAFSNTGINTTHTFPNLISEMSDLGFKKAVVLAVELMGSRNSERLLNAAKDLSGHVVPFVSVHPRRLLAGKVLKKHIKNGAKGLKVHPTIQTIKPSNPLVVNLCRIAGENDIPVIFHCGVTPLSPKLQENFNRMEDFEKCIAACPETKIILGHSGTTEYKKAIELAYKYPNVYLELSGQPPAAIAEMISELGDDRLLFGSDWPYYPIALPMAKVLVATEGKKKSRIKILRKNAEKLLHL